MAYDVKSVNTTLCYLRRGEDYLMLHRVKKQNDVNQDKWIGVGGKFEADESPEYVMNICLCIIKLIIVLMKSRENSRFLPSMKELTQERLNKSFLPGRK